MADRYDDYRKQAEHCERMAQRAPTAELRADWLRLAARWLAISPHESSTASDKFEQMLHDKGTGQKDSTSEH